MYRLGKKELESFDTSSLPNIQPVALWVIEYLSDQENDRFGSTETARYIVESLGRKTSKQAVQSALTRAVKNGLCHKDGRSGFKIMRKGQDELLRLMGQDRVIHLEPGKPFAASVEIGKILSQLSGDICINDPYVNDSTLDLVHKHLSGKQVSVHLLTNRVHEESRFKRALGNLVAEGMHVEVRKLSGKNLHDRYIMDDKSFWLLGSSLNRLGNKESFIVKLSGDIHQTMMQTFRERWQSESAAGI